MKVVVILFCALLSVQASNDHKVAEVERLQAFEGLNQFFEGFINGFKTSDLDTICLLSVRDLNGQGKDFLQYFAQFFQTGNFNNVWFALRELNEWANALDSALSDCNISLLITRIEEVYTLQQITAISTRFALNTDQLILDWQNFVGSWGTDWNTCGEAVGNILSITLGYSI